MTKLTIAVRYHSRSGNTKKVAGAIAGAAGVEAADCGSPLEQPVDLLFIGGGIYAGGVDDTLKAYISALDPGMVGRAAVFSTTAVKASGYAEIRSLLDRKGIPVAEEEFHCKGKFAVLHRSRPNEADLQRAAAFATSLVG